MPENALRSLGARRASSGGASHTRAVPDRPGRVDAAGADDVCELSQNSLEVRSVFSVLFRTSLRHLFWIDARSMVSLKDWNSVEFHELLRKSVWLRGPRFPR